MDQQCLLAICYLILHCHLSHSSGPCSHHAGHHVHHISHLLHTLLALSSSPTHHSHHQMSSSGHVSQPLELPGISSHLLPRPLTNCLGPVSDSPHAYQPSCVCPDHPNTIWCQCGIPSLLVYFPSSAQAAHKLSGASIRYIHFVHCVV